MAEDLLIRNVRRGGGRATDMLVRDGKIAAVGAGAASADATVFDAVFAGFRVWLIKDACGSGTDFMNRVAILDMANRLYGGGVLKTAEALKALRGEPHQAWRCSRPVEFQYTAATADTLYESL